MKKRLTDKLVLRTLKLTKLETLPLVYGKTIMPGIAYDTSERRFVVAGNPLKDITRVFIKGQEINGWSWENKLAPDGLPIAVLTTQKTYSSGNELEVYCESSITELNEIVQDILERIEIEYSPVDFSFNAEIGGTFTSEITAQSAIDEIMQGCGLNWCWEG